MRLLINAKVDSSTCLVVTLIRIKYVIIFTMIFSENVFL